MVRRVGVADARLLWLCGSCVIESRPRKFGHAGRARRPRARRRQRVAPPASRSVARVARAARRRPVRQTARAVPSGHMPRARPGTPLGARAGALFAAGRPVAVDGGSGRVIRAAFSFPDRRVDGEAFARSPCGSQNGAESRELVIEIRHIWTRASLTYGRDFDIYDRDSPFVIEICQSLRAREK